MPTIYYTYYTPVSSKILEVAAQEGKLGLRLLSHGLEELYGIHMSVDDISQHLTREEHGKPRLTDYPDIHFNITHCPDWWPAPFTAVLLAWTLNFPATFLLSSLNALCRNQKKPSSPPMEQPRNLNRNGSTVCGR